MPGDKKDAAAKGTGKDAPDAAAAAKAKKEEEEKAKKAKPPTLVQELKSNLDLIVKATENRTQGPILRVLRRTNHVRRHLPNAELSRFIETYVAADLPVRADLLTAVSELATTAKDSAPAAAAATDADAAPAGPEELAPLAGAGPHTAVEVYLSNIVINNLLCGNKKDTAAALAFKVLQHFSQFNHRNLDVFTAQTISFLSLAHQLLGTLSTLRRFLLKAHRSACLQHNEYGQATIINLLLRNFLNDNLYDQAAKFVAKVNFPEQASVNQYVRHLYYLGRIQCVQLQYTQSYSNLNQAGRKAPQNTGVGFRTAVTKLSIIVQLLMGDIPERSLFSEPSTAEAVVPYLELTQAVRFGRLDVFNEVLTKFEIVFRRDANFNLVQRLRQTVLKIGLRRINTAYSCISFADIAAKLKLDSAEAAEYVCAKNIRDGVIKAQLDHDLGAMLSQDQADLYSTSEPQQSFHDRISFCLEMHDSAVKAMRYPPNAFRTNSGDDAVIEDVDVGEVVVDSDSEADE